MRNLILYKLHLKLFKQAQSVQTKAFELRESPVNLPKLVFCTTLQFEEEIILAAFDRLMSLLNLSSHTLQRELKHGKFKGSMSRRAQLEMTQCFDVTLKKFGMTTSLQMRSGQIHKHRLNHVRHKHLIPNMI